MKKAIFLQNYAAFVPVENGDKLYRIEFDKSGAEVGFLLRGNVTDFNEVNNNGQRFDKNSYDKFIKEYFEKNELNIPIDVQHGRSVTDLCGVAKKFIKKSDHVEIDAFIPKGVYYYDLLKTLIDNGILQGFSNMGAVRDWEYDRQNDCYIIKDFALISVSLVDVPADASTKFVATNATNFEGFDSEDKKENYINIFDLL